MSSVAQDGGTTCGVRCNFWPRPVGAIALGKGASLCLHCKIYKKKSGDPRDSARMILNFLF